MNFISSLLRFQRAGGWDKPGVAGAAIEHSLEGVANGSTGSPAFTQP